MPSYKKPARSYKKTSVLPKRVGVYKLTRAIKVWKGFHRNTDGRGVAVRVTIPKGAIIVLPGAYSGPVSNAIGAKGRADRMYIPRTKHGVLRSPLMRATYTPNKMYEGTVDTRTTNSCGRGFNFSLTLWGAKFWST